MTTGRGRESGDISAKSTGKAAHAGATHAGPTHSGRSHAGCSHSWAATGTAGCPAAHTGNLRHSATAWRSSTRATGGHPHRGRHAATHAGHGRCRRRFLNDGFPTHGASFAGECPGLVEPRLLEQVHLKLFAVFAVLQGYRRRFNADDLKAFRVKRTWVRGQMVAEEGRSLIASVPSARPNTFACLPKRQVQFHVPATTEDLLVLEALDGQLITPKKWMPPTLAGDACVPDTEKDLLKIAVVNRYREAPPAVGWITNFGLKRGAIAGSVAHDSHNIVAVGTNDADLCAAINLVIHERGGISWADGTKHGVLALPVAGIMSDADAHTIADAYAAMDHDAKDLGSQLSAPYMTLSFMALLVIPHLKMSDLGLFDGDTFQLC